MKYYKFVADEAGMEGSVELAKRTKVAVIIAAHKEDSVENIVKFRKAIKEITGRAAPQF